MCITWLLSSIPTLYISKEIIQRADLPNFNGKEKTAHVRQALLYPTGKLSTSRGWLPTSRFLEDYVFHPTMKMFRSLDHIGFSLNPEFCKGIDWRTATKDIKDVKMIVFERSNLAKSAVSAYRGYQTKQLCGTANLRSDSTCTIPSELGINTTEYLRSMQMWYERNANFRHYLAADPVLSILPTMHVYYEDMQADPEGTMKQIQTFLAADKLSRGNAKSGKTRTEWTTQGSLKKEQQVPQQQVATTGSRSWVKRSPEDLEGVLVQFQLINETLLRAPACKCWQKQLTATTCHREDYYNFCLNEHSSEVRGGINSTTVTPHHDNHLSACYEELESKKLI